MLNLYFLNYGYNKILGQKFCSKFRGKLVLFGGKRYKVLEGRYLKRNIWIKCVLILKI